MKDRIEAGLRDLRASIRKMKELCKWRKLQEQEERSDTPPSFRLQDHLESDIELEESFFLKTAWDICSVLAESNDPTAKAQRKRLLAMEEEMRGLTRRE